MATNDTLQRMQEIARRGLQDRLPPEKRAIFDEAARRGLIQVEAAPQEEVTPPNQATAKLNALQQQFPELANQEVLGSKEVTPRTMAEIGAMGVGGAVGGPVGAAGGYALADQLFDKYQEGREITPSSAAKSFGTGLLYEAIPKTALAVGGKLIPKGLEEKVMQSALKPTTTTGVRGAKQKARTALDERFILNEKGIETQTAKVKALGKEVTDEIKAGAKQGDTIDPNVMYSRIIGLKDQYKDLPGGQPILQNIDNIVQKWVDQYGTKPIPVDEALRMKRTADKYLTTYWRRMSKGDPNLITPLEKDAIAKGVNGLRHELAKMFPTTRTKNRRIHNIIQAMGDAEKRVVSQGNKNMIPFGTAETIGVSKALGGNAALATTAVGGRAILEMPGVKSRLALMLRDARTNRGGAVPPAYINRILEEYLSGGE